VLHAVSGDDFRKPGTPGKPCSVYGDGIGST